MALSFHVGFDGRCEEAFNLYARVLGGRIGTLVRAGEGAAVTPHGPPAGKVVHANIRIEDVELAGSDAPPGHYTRPQGMHLLLGLPSEARVRTCFDALQDGGEVVMAPQRTFWSPCYAIVVDRFGVPWKLNCGD